MEIKEFIDYLGIEDFNIEENTLDDFKAKFESTWLTREQALQDDEIKSKVSGGIYGGLSTMAKRSFGFKNGDIEGSDLGEIIKKGTETLNSKIAALEAQLGENNTDEKAAALMGELKDANSKLEEYEAKMGDLVKEKDTIVGEYENKYKSFKINNILGEVKSKLPLKEMNDIERVGFDNYLNSNFKFDLEKDEANNRETLVVTDANGKRIKDPNVASKYLGVEDIIKDVAEKNKLLRVNNGGGGATVVIDPKEDKGGEPSNKRTVAPHIAAAAERRKAEMSK